MQMNKLTAFAITAIFLCVTVAQHAQTSAEFGTISGRIVDEATGDPIENVRVTLAGTAHVASTDRTGAFTLRAVPAGEYTLTTLYTGFDTAKRAVPSQSGRDTKLEIALVAGPVSMEAFVVNFRRGEAEEIMQRRQATNIVDVVSSKTFGEMADGSLSISRLAGMTGGTGIRGIAGEFNLVRVDGAALATPSDSTASGTTRSVDINQTPGDMIERIEVTKSPRPDMDADAVGGTIN